MVIVMTLATGKIKKGRRHPSIMDSGSPYQAGLCLFELTAGFVTLGLCGLSTALSLTGILSLAAAAGCFTGTLSLAGVSAHTMSHRFGGIGGKWCGNK